MALPSGTRIGSYEILDQLGAGGMGEVYRARDIKLKREVALKVLPQPLARAPALMMRFQREAEVLASLNHPHIATLFGIGETGHMRALVMELVDGVNLPSPLDIPTSLGYAKQIVEALEYAHEKGVIHRDLKPGNIKVTSSGSVKILDFGLAKAVGDDPEEIMPEADGDATLGASRGGNVLGTAAYMSPEQAHGRSADRRSDIWSFGAVLYEMLAGKRAFEGESASDTIASVLRSEPDWTALPADVPPSIRDLIQRCLTKERNQRLQTIGEARIVIEQALQKPSAPVRLTETVDQPVPRRRALIVAGEAVLASAILGTGAIAYWRRGGRSGAGQPVRSIAVLRFEDLSSAKDQDYFARGLGEELVNRLAGIPGLQVCGVDSSFQFRDGGDYRTIGEKLHVDTLLAGSVRNSSDTARIAVKLIKTADRAVLWTDTFDRKLNDIVGVQQDIAMSVASELKVRLSEQNAARRPNPDAYKAYLQGRFYMGNDTQEALVKAVAYFEHAIELDPNYAPSWAGLGQTRTTQAAYAYVPSDDGFHRAKAAVDKALAIDKDEADAHATLGWIMLLHDWDWASADASYKRALAIEPNNAGAIRVGAAIAMVLGNFPEAIALSQKAVTINPLSAGDFHNLGTALLYAGRGQEAEAALKKALDVNPTITFTHCVLGRVYLSQSKLNEALDQMQREPEPAYKLLGLVLANHALQRHEASNASLAELTGKFQKENPYQIAVAYAFRGEADQAFQWLDRAYAAHDSSLPEVNVDPTVRLLKQDPRYSALLKKIGFKAGL